jgi:hypothetical protein
MSDSMNAAMLNILGACADLAPADRVMALSTVWILAASEARSAALIEPGGFPAERDRQLKILSKFAEMIAGDEPDLELERLGHEGDVDGISRHMRARLRELDEDGSRS